MYKYINVCGVMCSCITTYVAYIHNSHTFLPPFSRLSPLPSPSFQTIQHATMQYWAIQLRKSAQPTKAFVTVIAVSKASPRETGLRGRVTNTCGYA